MNTYCFTFGLGQYLVAGKFVLLTPAEAHATEGLPLKHRYVRVQGRNAPEARKRFEQIFGPPAGIYTEKDFESIKAQYGYTELRWLEEDPEPDPKPKPYKSFMPRDDTVLHHTDITHDGVWRGTSGRRKE